MYLEALTSETKKLWPRLNKFSEFVLAGGTALALQLGHRVSADFDFFSEKEIESSLLERVEDIFKNSAIAVVLNTSEQLTVTVAGVKITFLAYRFRRQREPVILEGVRLLGIHDIAVSKAYALGRRATLKDYVDLYFIILEGHLVLNEIIRLAQTTYGDAFDPRLFLEELVYLDDVSDEPIEFLKPAVSKKDIESFFEKKIAMLDIERE
ncbi:MAG: nucleotidyl transferase AbiEii/AbiGii toxin family protein [bacterium]|nr:nucleotidyl transferase AbiEii/AbiGii toxin family protein [bacterium]